MGLLAQRDRQPEIMDRPDLAVTEHEHALAGLSRINFFSATARSYLRSLRGLSVGSAPLRILDIACGGGDVVRRLARYGARHGLPWHVAGCDLSPVAVEHAQRQAHEEKVAVEYFVHDALASPPPGDHDAVICSLFLHHLEEPQAVRLLELLAKTRSVRAIFVSDLNRSVLGLVLAHAACRLLSTSSVVHTDGPLSVRAAFTPTEAAAIADKAGLRDVSIRRCWPCRWMMSWRRA
jgi:2-polyprenyl-3-methyl-5-hydroxy-6-metoxy-1,4-benzoquinol methylase